MKLALFLNIKFYYDGEKYTADEQYFKFWTSFTKYFEKVILCVPVLTSSSRKGNFEVDLGRRSIEICHLPFYNSATELYTKSLSLLPEVRRIVSDNIINWDVVGAVVPNILGMAFLRYAKSFSKPCFAYIRGNHMRTVKYEYRGIKKWIACFISLILDHISGRLVASTLTLVVGEELYMKFKKKGDSVFKIVVSLISINDIKKKIVLCSTRKQKINLLHVGRLSPERGISYLIEGVILFKERYDGDVALTIVGSGAEESVLKKKVRENGLDGNINFTGYIPYGKDIVGVYQNSDIFILPSLSEGVPKTMLESMANGVPVIATSVGGIPEIIKDGVNGLLIPPADPSAIANAIYRLINNCELRIRIAKNGLETMKEYSLESQRDRIVEILQTQYSLNFSS